MNIAIPRKLQAVIAPIAGALQRRDHVSPGGVHIVVAMPRQPVEVRSRPREAVVDELLEVASTGFGGGVAMQELASAVLASRPSAGMFDCVVVTGETCGLVQLPSMSGGEEGRFAVAMAIAALRGLTDGEPPRAGMPEPYAVRAADCEDCRRWEAALREAKIPLVGRVALQPAVVRDGRCEVCVQERASALRVARELFGLGEDEVRAAAEPRAVLGALADLEAN
jgi:hypothetical protein